MIFLFRLVKIAGHGCVVTAACIQAADDMMTFVRMAIGASKQKCWLTT